jgi:pimeloyl-ACP methyl ester carboxylesterase
MKPPLLLLHGALADARQFTAFEPLLQNHFDTDTISFSGHGGSAVEAAFTCDLFAAEVLRKVDSRWQGAPVHLFGYSMGGYVALYIARHFPSKVQSVFTVATKLNWAFEAAVGEINKLDLER